MALVIATCLNVIHCTVVASLVFGSYSLLFLSSYSISMRAIKTHYSRYVCMCIAFDNG